MDEYVGKICPYCKTAIGEGEAVKVCPACGVVHHEGCWVENKGCTTFGCGEKYEPPVVQPPVETTGASYTVPLDGSAPQTYGGAPQTYGGAPQTSSGYGMPVTGVAAAGRVLCSKCGAELPPGLDCCPRCGQQAQGGAGGAAFSAIDQYNASVTAEKKKSKAVPIVVALALVACIIVGFFVIQDMNAKKAAEARMEYLEDAQMFMELTLDAGVVLEDVADTVQTYWYENIWYDMHGSDINDAIYYALIEMSDEIEEAEGYDSRIDSLYAGLKNLPDEIADEDRYELEQIRDAIRELYDVYEEYYTLATDPSGSYNSYSEANGDLTDEFLECYETLYELLE